MCRCLILSIAISAAGFGVNCSAAELAEIRRFKHQGPVYQVAYSPSGKYAVSSDDKGSLCIWDVESGDEVRRLSHDDRQILCTAYSPDDRYVLSGHLDGTIRMWDVQTGKAVRTFGKHSGFVTCVDYSPDGATILSGGTDCTVRVWDVETGKELKNFKQSFDTISHVAISADSRRALCAGGYHANSDTKTGHLVRVLDLQSGKPIFDYDPKVRTSIETAAFSLDGKRIATLGFNGGRLGVWDVEKGTRLLALPEDESIQALAMSRDETYLLAGNAGGTLHLWDLKTKTLVHVYKGHDRPVASVAIAPDGKTALSAGHDGSVILWRMPETYLIRRSSAPAGQVAQYDLDAQIYSLDLTQDGKQFLAYTEGSLRLYDLKTGTQLKRHSTAKASDVLNQVACSPVGRYALLGAGVQQNAGRCTIWDLEKWGPAMLLEPTLDLVRSVAWSADGSLAASGMNEGAIQIWDAKSGKPLQTIEPIGRRVRSLSFSPNGKQLAAGAGQQDHHVHVFDVQTAKVLHSLAGHLKPVVHVAFLAENRLLSGDQEGIVRVWNLDGGKELRQFSARASCLAVSSDSRYAITGSEVGTIALWDLESGKQLQEFAGHRKLVTSVVFTPDDCAAVSCSLDQTVRIWRLPGKDLPELGQGVARASVEPVKSPRDELVAQLQDLKTRCTVAQSGPQKGEILSLAVLPQTQFRDEHIELLARCSHLQSLVLDRAEVTNEGLVPLKKLAALRTLSLADTKVTGPGLVHLAACRNLSQLNLRNLAVTDADLSHLAEIEKLSNLDLTGTNVKGSGLAALRQKSIDQLSLRDTKVDDDSLSHLKSQVSLTSLDLWGTPISGSGLKHLKKLKQLRMLQLVETQISDEGLEELSRLPNLQYLQLSGAPITDAALSKLGKLTHLKQLSVRSDRVTDSGVKHLAGLADLRELAVGGAQLSNTSVAHLAGLAQLEELYLTGAGQVTEDAFPDLRKLPKLTRLSLNGTAISDAGAMKLIEFQQLKWLVVSQTKVSAGTASALRKAMPGCQIAH